MKSLKVSYEFAMRGTYEVQVPDDFEDVNCEEGSDEDAEFLRDRLDQADFVEIANAAGGGEFEVDTWSLAKTAV